MHRTETIDYGIVIEGELVLIMDEGETVVRAGDIVIQRGTNHGWANRSDSNCRIAFILIDGEFDRRLCGMKPGDCRERQRAGWCAGRRFAATARAICTRTVHAPNLLAAMDDWEAVAPGSRVAVRAPELGRGTEPAAARRIFARRLPRSLAMARRFGVPDPRRADAGGVRAADPIETDRPLMYQGISDRFYRPPRRCPFAERSATASISRASSA